MSDETKNGATEEDPVKSEEQKRLEEEKALATLRKEIAEAEKALLKAKLPTSDTDGAEGTVTLSDNAGSFVEILAYKTLAEAAEEIHQRIRNVTPGPVVLVDEPETGRAGALRERIELRLSEFDRSFDELLRKYTPKAPEMKSFGAAGILALLPALLGAASDVASFFRVNRKLTGRKVEVNNEGLVAEVARVLIANKKEVYIPSLAIGAPTALIRQLSEIRNKRLRAGSLRDDLRADPEKWKAAEKDFALLEAFDAYVSALVATPSGGGPSPLETVAAVDHLHENETARLLYVNVISQGGEVETTEGSFKKGKITFLAGTVVVFFLIDPKGRLLASGTLPHQRSERFQPK